ncbi:unnamed protein product, partial [Allacma fusca]
MRENQKKRFKDIQLVETVIDQDKIWRQLRFQADSLNRLRNQISKAMGEKMKKKEEPGETGVNEKLVLQDLTPEQLKSFSVGQLKTLRARLEVALTENTKALEDTEKKRNESLREVGNILHPSVPVSDDEDKNRIERTWGDIAAKKKYSHVDLITMINGADLERGAVTAGGRGYYLTGPAVYLQQALVQLALRILGDKDYVPLYTPFFMRKDIMQEVAQLSQFDEELYKVVGKGSENPNEHSVDEKYLIATSEQPIAAFHRDEWVAESSLPIKYADPTTLASYDGHLENVLKLFSSEPKLLRKSLIVLIGDHGSRWGHYDGRSMDSYIERASPPLFIRIPDQMAEEFPDIVHTLRINSKILTTPFDVHHTLRHILQFKTVDLYPGGFQPHLCVK